MNRLASGLISVVLIAAACGSTVPQQRPPGDQLGPGGPNALTAAEVQFADRFVERLDASFGSAEGGATLLDQPAGPTYVALRTGGRRMAAGWGLGSSGREALLAAVLDALRGAGSDFDRQALDALDVVEVSLGEAPSPLDSASRAARLSNANRGLLGLEVEAGGQTVRFAASEMVARNLGFDGALQAAAEASGMVPSAFEAQATLSTIETRQFLVRVADSAVAPMYRGNVVVPPEAVTTSSVAGLAAGMGDWLVRQVSDDGRMTYKYWPSRGEESEADNTIRQWMATVALERLAARSGDPAIWDAARRNIEYNLEHYFELDGDLGFIIDPDGEVKLGAVALAAVALIEHPDRADFAAQEAALRRSVDSLWSPDGSFRTFLRPSFRNDNQNFYPGEALVLWATLLGDAPDPALLERFMASFRYYRAFHRANVNPAFIPWHTQADAAVFEQTGDRDLSDFVLEMNDWLVGFQQWDGVAYPDFKGRFYDPDHPEYGPPHASSDGVYLEGLVAARRVALAVGDTERAERYRLAIARVLRHAMQLQFADDVDLFYVSQRDRVAGALRSTPYDNEIRVDNVQHTLMGVLPVLDAFEAGDFGT